MLDNDSVYKKLHDNYVKSFNSSVERCPIHQEHLNRLRAYLDSKGKKMPKPKWKFDYKDYNTWPYLPGYIIKKANGDSKHIHSINQDFKFKHLL